jgi:hypothetical protein
VDASIATLDASDAGEGVASRRKLALSLGGAFVALCLTGGVAVALIPRNGAPLPPNDRVRLLQQAGLPADFPVHPEARRMAQPDQGGITYAVPASVPDVLEWYLRSLQTAGYDVFGADVAGQDEFLPRWVYFRSDAGGSGAIIIRTHRERFNPLESTEVKVLSRADSRLAPPPLPTESARR